MGIFRQQKFTCAGCGRSKTAKITVDPEAAKDPIAPPPEWHNISLTSQDPNFGGIASVVLFTCSEACAATVESGKGAAASFLQTFKAFCAGQGAKNVLTLIDADEDEDEGDDVYVDDEQGPQVPSA